MPSMYASPCQSFLNLAEVPQPPAFDKFTLFPDLPVELRIVIWKLAIPEERVIEIHVNKDSNKYFTDTNVPAALHTCRESRELALEEYVVIGFGNGFVTKQPQSSGGEEGSEDGLSQHLRQQGCIANSNTNDHDDNYKHETSDDLSAGLQAIELNTKEPDFQFSTYINYSRDTIYLSHAAAFLNSLAKAPIPRDNLQLLAFDKLYGVNFPAQTIHAFRGLRKVEILVEDDKDYTSCEYYSRNRRQVIRFDKPYCRNDYRFRMYSENDRTESDDVIYHEHYLGKVNDFKGCLEYCIKLDRFESDGTGNPDDLLPLKEWIDVEFVPRFVAREPNPKMLMPWALD